MGYVLGTLFVLVGLHEAGRSGFWSFIGGLLTVALGILFLCAESGTRQNKRKEEIKKVVEDVLEKRSDR